LIGAGKFVTAGTINWRMKKNGASVATSSSSVAANTYYTLQAYFLDVAVGDILELALWSNQTNSNWDYKAYQILVTRVILFNKPRLLSPCKFSAMPLQPTLSYGSVRFTYDLYVQHLDFSLYSAIFADTTFNALYPLDTYGLWRIQRGDYNISNTGEITTSSTTRPYYDQNRVPTQITMRGVKID
jgi:hypothetical protein